MNETTSSPSPLNFPNLLTSLRLILAIALFIVVGIAQFESTAAQSKPQLYWAALIIFVIAASTDWIDGFWARRYGQVTVLGRIFDPFVDKVIICGTFIFLVASPESQVTAWMAVVVTGREMLVTVLRSFFEQQGIDFSAKMAGKLKMVLQCLAVVASFYLLTFGGNEPSWLTPTVVTILWAAILLTLYSGGEYLVAATRLMRQ